MASQSRDLWVLDRNIDGEELYLARMIYEHFCYNRQSAATTSLRSAGSPLGPSTYCTSMHQFLRGPCAGLATRLSDFATNRHEEYGLAILLISIIPIYSNNVTHTVSH